MNSSGKLTCAFVLASVCSNVYAYEITTHTILSEQAALRSRIYTDPSLFSDLDLTPATLATFTSSDINGVSSGTWLAKDIVGYGSKLEDYIEPSCNLDQPQNTINWGWMRVFKLTTRQSLDLAFDDATSYCYMSRLSVQK